MADGTTVHVVSHCYDFFWCHLIQERPSAWYDLLPQLQASAGFAVVAAAAAPPQATAVAAAATLAADLLALRPEAIHVAVHMRTVKRRRLKNAYYGTLVAALRRSPRRYTLHVPIVRALAVGISLFRFTCGGHSNLY